MTYPVAVDTAFARHDKRRIYSPGTNLWASEMFPYLEPYRSEHAAFFDKLLMKACVGRRDGNCTCTKHAAPKVSNGLYILLRDWVVVWQLEDGSFHKLVVPAGFVTDCASIPWIFQGPGLRMLPDGNIRPAAVAHDLLYQLQRDIVNVPAVFKWNENCYEWERDQRAPSKADDDKFFAKIMKAYGTRLSSLAYWGVRLGGYMAYWSKDPTRHYTMALYNVATEARNGWRL